MTSISVGTYLLILSLTGVEVASALSLISIMPLSFLRPDRAICLPAFVSRNGTGWLAPGGILTTPAAKTIVLFRAFAVASVLDREVLWGKNLRATSTRASLIHEIVKAGETGQVSRMIHVDVVFRQRSCGSATTTTSTIHVF